MQPGRVVIAGFAVLAAFVYLNNASWLAPRGSGKIKLLAHRGVHQNYIGGAHGKDACTARPIADVDHTYIENTLPSMQAAFDAGADVVELDIHPTTDGQLAVFHDWTLDCRTNGTGVTREQTYEYLESLDAGYGYARADGTTPLRGTGVGQIPTLTDVLDAFGDHELLINFKSNDPHEADLLAATLDGRDLGHLAVYGGRAPTERTLELVPEVRGYTRHSLKWCATAYGTLGWTGYVPRPCRHTILVVPQNVAPFVWGWPHRFIRRMHRAGTDVYVIGDYHRGDHFSHGIDDEEAFARLPEGFSGGVWTNRIEVIGGLQSP